MEKDKEAKEENDVVEDPVEVPKEKVKKPRSAKQIAAFERARLIRQENARARQQSKVDSIKGMPKQKEPKPSKVYEDTTLREIKRGGESSAEDDVEIVEEIIKKKKTKAKPKKKIIRRIIHEESSSSDDEVFEYNSRQAPPQQKVMFV